MTHRERIINAAHMQATDVVPVAPYTGNYGAALAGTPISTYCTNGQAMADAQSRAQEILNLDAVVVQSENYYIAEGFGCQIEQPYNQTPHLVKPALNSIYDVPKLKIPDVYSDGRMHVYLEACRIMAERFKGDVAIRTPGTGPFSLAGHALGTSNLLIEIATAEVEEDQEVIDLVMQLMDFTTTCLINFCKAGLEAGSDFIICADSSASPDLASPHIYEKFILPYEKRFFKELAPLCKKFDAVGLLHICGDTSKILPFMSQSGADILEIDYKVDISLARQLAGDSVCLMGNLDPSSVLLQGTPDEVYQHARALIEKVGKNGGLILGSGCEVATATPVENIQAMVRAAREYHF